MQDEYDLLIVGGGLAGNCLALALQQTDLNIAIIEANTREQLHSSPAGDRALALAAGTVKMLDALGAWQGIADKATAIKNIHISDRGHFGKARLSAKREKVEALGYVISARDIEDHVAALVAGSSIVQYCPARVVGLMSARDQVSVSLKQDDKSLTLSARLLVGADGGNSSIRNLLEIAQQTTEYGQTALVTTVKSSLPNNNVAYERFTSSGPLAMLPVGTDQCSVVWTRSHQDAKALMTGNEDDFIEQLQADFGYRLGQLTLTAPRRAFPLTLVRAQQMFSGRAVIVGNAVHQLHPVAGQGFNLGLRDVVQLAEMILHQHQDQKDIGGQDFLKAYEKARIQDHDRVIGFTDNVVRIFSNEWLSLAAVRNLGLVLLDHIPQAKSWLSRQAMGIAGRMPRIGNRR